MDLSIPVPEKFEKLLSLEGSTAIVTGGSRGIGRQVAMRLAEAGANVVITARGEDQLRETERQLCAEGLSVAAFRADVTSVDDMRATVDFAVERFGGVHILVNNAASFPFCSPMDMSERVWDECFAIDARGTFFMSQIAAAQMIKQGEGGRIVNFMSTAALNPPPLLVAYGAAKSAAWYVTQSMAADLAKHRITVNAATPGATMTPERIAAFGGDKAALGSMLKSLGNEGGGIDVGAVDTSAFQEILGSTMPMGRTGYPDDLAKAVLFLCSDMAAYVTGVNIVVDGAQSLQNPMFAAAGGSGAMDRVFGGKGHEDDEPGETVADLGSVDPDAPLAGTWKAVLDTPMGKNEMALDLRVSGSVLGGTVKLAGSEAVVEKGVVDGDEFSFAYKMKSPLGVGKVKVQITGKLEGGRILGTVKIPVGGFDFEAVRC